MDAHDVASAQRSLKQTDDEGFADLGVGALHSSSRSDRQTAADTQRPAFDMTLDKEVPIRGDLSDNSRP